MYCNKCGSPISDDARFCPVCGNAVVRVAEQPDIPNVPGAQQRNTPSARPGAGRPSTQQGMPSAQPGAAPLHAAPAAQQEIPAVSYGPAARYAAPNDPVVPQPSAQPASPKPRRRKKPLVAAAIALVAVLGVGGGALFYFMQLAPIKIDEQTFPDAGLRALVSTKFDIDGDGKLSRDEVKAVTKIDLTDVASTQGLGKALPELAVVEGGDKKLDYLDLSGCDKLQKVSLDAASNIKSVDLDGCDDITELSLANADDLKQVDLTGKKKLASLSLSQSTDVKGIGDTQLDELWLPVSYESTDKSDTYGSTMDIERDDDGYVTSYVSGVKQGGGYTVDVEHDKAGQISTMTKRYAGDYDTVYSFERDKDGKVVSVDDDEALGDASTTYRYEYDSDGNLAAIRRPTNYGAQDSVFAYQHGKMVTDTELSAANPHKVVYSYAYDKAGNVSSHIEDVQGDTVGTTWTLTMGYEYDKDGRVTRIAPTAYDTHGNDYGSLSESFAAVDYAYDRKGRLSKIESERGGAYAEFSYDGHGNLYEIDEYNGDDEVQYTYELGYQRYFCNKQTKNKPEEWIRLGAGNDVDRGSWGDGSDYGKSYLATAFVLDPLSAIPEPFNGSRQTLR